MSNFVCSECGMVNIDCGTEGYKTALELQYESVLHQIYKLATYHGSYEIPERFEKIAKLSQFEV